MFMICYSSRTVPSLSGHTITFEAGKKTFVPDDALLLRDCRAAGAIELTPEIEASLAHSASAAAADPEYQAFLAMRAAQAGEQTGEQAGDQAGELTESTGLPSQEDNLDDEDKTGDTAGAAEPAAATPTKPARRAAGAKAA